MFGSCKVALSISSKAKIIQLPWFSASYCDAHIVPYIEHCVQDFGATTLVFDYYCGTLDAPMNHWMIMRY